MEKSKLSKFSSTFIIGVFLLVILSTVFYSIYNKVVGNATDGIAYVVVIVSIIFLVVFILSEKVYKSKYSIIPEQYYYITMIFALLSTYLGSFLNFYERFDWWDTMLHFSSGILIGLLSIVLVSFVVTKKFGVYKTKSDIVFLVVVAVLVAVSIGVFWEFYEYMFDLITGGNMQRGVIIDNPSTFDPTPYMRSSGRMVGPDLHDTMADLFLATVGALIAGVYSFLHFNSIQLHLVDVEETTNKK